MLPNHGRSIGESPPPPDIKLALLAHPSVGRVEVSYSVLECVSVLPKAKGFGGTWLHYQGRRSPVCCYWHRTARGWQTCLGPTFNTLDEDSLTPGLRLEP